MRLTVSSVFLLLALSAITATAENRAPATSRDAEPSDFYGAASVSDPQVSPDGEWIAYLVGTNDRVADEPRSAVWMVSWNGAQHVALTRAAKGVRAPRWSPDGRYLAFIAASAASQSDELRIIDRRGGEPLSLCKGTDITTFAWSPDGTRLVAAMQSMAEPAAAAPRPIVIRSLYFKQDEDGYLDATRRSRLVLVEVPSGRMHPIPASDSGSSPVSDTLPEWSPDGGRIAFVRTHEQGADPDGMEDILTVDARADVPATRLLRTYVPNRQKLLWSRDGATLAYLTGQQPKYNQYIQDRLAVVTLGGGAPRVLTAALDRAVTSFALAGSDALAATIADDGAAYAIRIVPNRGGITRLTQGAHVVSSISHAAGHTAVLYTDDAAPPEVYALEAGGLRKLTSHNDALMARLHLAAVQDFRFKSKDGTTVDGFALTPPEANISPPYPTIVWLHGGPNGQDAHELTFSGDQWKRQLFAAAGFAVIGINYRGSSGRGSAFQTAIAADWGHLEIEDVLAGLDQAVASGLADPKRLGIGGWSYGAILSDYAIAADRRFKAAVSGAGSANVTAMYGGDEYIIQYTDELGAPWLNTRRWLALSAPFLHAARIHTPTLFMGGDRDFDVPLIGAEQMYQALRTLEVPTQLVVYPGEFHTLRRPSFLVDRAQRMTAWFRQYLHSQPTQ